MTSIRSTESTRHEQAAILRTVGERMREAREMCGMSQAVAAKRLGLPNSGRLSKIESAFDVRVVPEWLKIRAAKLYQVSLDYLYGASDDWETDARMTQEREVGAYMLETWEVMRRRDMETLLKLHNQNEELRASITLSYEECSRLVDGIRRFADLNPMFERMKGSAMIAGPAERAMESTANGVRLIKRFRMRCQLAAKGTHQLSLQIV